ncbi:hypothetical protein NMG60_11027368 [Bertholletia excelsa]
MTWSTQPTNKNNHYFALLPLFFLSENKLHFLFSPAETHTDRSAAKEREAEPDSEVTLLNEIRDLFRWHPWKNHLRNFAHEDPLNFFHEKKTSKNVNCSTSKSPIEKNATSCCSESECVDCQPADPAGTEEEGSTKTNPEQS